MTPTSIGLCNCHAFSIYICFSCKLLKILYVFLNLYMLRLIVIVFVNILDINVRTYIYLDLLCSIIHFDMF